MPLPPQINQSTQATTGLNPFQANRLAITCHYIDRLLADIESILNPVTSNAAFPRYAPDIPPSNRVQMQNGISQMRTQMIDALRNLEIPEESPSIPASRAVHALLDAIDIAVQELRPRYMRGYGAVGQKAAADLDAVVGKFSSLVIEINHAVPASPHQP